MTHDEATKRAREIAGPCDIMELGLDRVPVEPPTFGRAVCQCGPCERARTIAAALVEASEEAAKAAYRKAAQEHAEDIQRQRMVPVPPGHVLTDDGVVRKVLGRLVPTGDGCIIGTGARYYLKPSRSQPLVRERNMRPTALEWHSTVFSTKEAAEAARKEKA